MPFPQGARKYATLHQSKQIPNPPLYWLTTNSKAASLIANPKFLWYLPCKLRWCLSNESVCPFLKWRNRISSRAKPNGYRINILWKMVSRWQPIGCGNVSARSTQYYRQWHIKKEVCILLIPINVWWAIWALVIYVILDLCSSVNEKRRVSGKIQETRSKGQSSSISLDVAIEFIAISFDGDLLQTKIDHQTLQTVHTTSIHRSPTRFGKCVALRFGKCVALRDVG